MLYYLKETPVFQLPQGNRKYYYRVRFVSVTDCPATRQVYNLIKLEIYIFFRDVNKHVYFVSVCLMRHTSSLYDFFHPLDLKANIEERVEQHIYLAN